MRWSEDSFTKFTYLQDIDISSGGQIAYVLRKANLKENRYENTIVIETPGGERRFIDDGSMPRFSPDGKKLLYLKVDEERKRSDLYLVDLATMTGKRLVEAKNIKGIAWNRDSRRILILISKKLDDEDLWYDSSLPVWFNGEGFRDSERFVVQIYDTEGEVVLEEFEEENIIRAIWHGDEIVYTVKREDSLFKFYDIKRYRGKKETIMARVPYEAIDSNGRDILLHGRRGRKYLSQHYYLYILRDGEIVDINERYGLDTHLGRIAEDGAVYGVVADRGSMVLEEYRNGERRRMTPEGNYVYSLAISTRGVTYLMMNDTSPGEAYFHDGRKGRKITSYNSEILKVLKPMRHRHFQFESFDGKVIDAWYIKPRGRGKKPLIVFVHGGPKGMYGYYFHYNAQLMASLGYYVLFVNPRGSDGYSEEFALEVLGRTGMEDFRDIMSGLNALLERERNIDRDRIGITGISYGGYMTNWAITQSDVFKVAISENGISYWLTSYAFSDIGLWFDREVIGDDPLNNENYRKLSPLFHVDNVRASVLLIHSMEDYRCPLDQSLMFYNLLRERGKNAHIVVFKQGEHGHSVRGKPRHRLKRYRIFVEFFERKMRGEEFIIENVLRGDNCGGVQGR